jgi:DNA polymerase-3 subunit alpha
MDEPSVVEVGAASERTVHLDVTSCFSLYQSPTTPEEYARAAGQFARVGGAPPVLALADYGLQGAIRIAAACREHGVEHVVGLRVRVVPARAFRPWDERPGELVLLAADEEGWLNLVALTNLGHLAGWSASGPRVDWQDLAGHAGGLICLSGPPGAGLLTPYLERPGDADAPPEAVRAAAALAELFPGRLYLELVYHGQPLDKLVNRRLVALGRRLGLPLVATNAVRFAAPEQALAHATLEAIGRGRRVGGLVGPAAERADLPTITIDGARSHAYLKSGPAMRRWFASLPEALENAAEVARRCVFRLPLADRPPGERYGPRLFGLARRDDAPSRLRERARGGLAARYAAEGRGAPPPEADERLEAELALVAEQGIAELLLAAADAGESCRAQAVPAAARGSATASLLCWALGLVELNPLDHDLPPDAFVYSGRSDPPDVDLEVALLYAESVRARLTRPGRPHGPDGLPLLTALRLGAPLSLGARQAVRDAGAALGLEPARVNALARLVPILSSPGAIEEVVTRAPELGVGNLSPSAEPYRTVVQVAAALESLPRRFRAHPTALAFDPAGGPGLLRWLPAQWVGEDARRPDRRFPALLDDPARAALAHPAGAPLAAAFGAVEDEPDGDAGGALPTPSGPSEQPTLACQWSRDDFELLGISKVDVSASASVGIETRGGGPTGEAAARAWHLIAGGETLCVAHLETIGVRMLLRRAREAHAAYGAPGAVLGSVEDLAQLLALWRPGAYARQREDAYLAVRYGREPPVYPHPDVASVLDRTAGCVLYLDQLAELAGLVGCDRAWAEAHRRAVRSGELRTRLELEARLRARARERGWTDEQVDGLLVMLGEHAGYLFNRGHALAQAQNALRQAARKADRASAAGFFCEVLNAGGSLQYGLGTAVEEARRAGVRILPPCVNRSGDRFVVEDGDGVRVPLAAVRGLSGRAAQHVLAVRDAFGAYASLLDVCRRVDRRLVSRQDLLLLIKVGALGFTGLSRAQLTLAEQYYAAAGDLLRAADRRPAELEPVEEELVAGAGKYVAASEWPPEVLAAYDLAHLGFYVNAPLAGEQYADELERLGAVPLAELADHPDRAEVVAGAVVTALRIRNTRKGEPMAWLTLADGTGAVDAAVFPSAYPRCKAVLREGAFVAARGRIAHEEAGPRLFIDELRALGGSGARVGALVVAVETRAQRRARSA